MNIIKRRNSNFEEVEFFREGLGHKNGVLVFTNFTIQNEQINTSTKNNYLKFIILFTMKLATNLFLPVLMLILFSCSLHAQTADEVVGESASVTDFSDRQAIIRTVENFFIGDHTGSIKHKKLSMHEKGAYRYVSKDGEYGEYVFDLESDDLDTSYKEELLSIEIYGKLALARLRLAENDGGHHYKLLTLHEFGDEWKITTITWGFGITQ